MSDVENALHLNRLHRPKVRLQILSTTGARILKHFRWCLRVAGWTREVPQPGFLCATSRKAKRINGLRVLRVRLHSPATGGGRPFQAPWSMPTEHDRCCVARICLVPCIRSRKSLPHQRLPRVGISSPKSCHCQRETPFRWPLSRRIGLPDIGAGVVKRCVPSTQCRMLLGFVAV